MNFSLPKTSFSVGQRQFQWIQKYWEWISPQKFNFQSQQPTTKPKKKRKKEGKCLLCLLFLCCITGCEFAFGFSGLFCNFPQTLTWPEWEMPPIPLPWKEHLWWKSVARLSFHPCEEQEKTFITTLLCTDKVSLFIQSGRDKPWMKHCGAAGEMLERGKRQEAAAWFSIPCVCPCEQMASIEKTLPRLVGRLEAEPLLSPPSGHLYYHQQSPFLPPRAPRLN